MCRNVTPYLASLILLFSPCTLLAGGKLFLNFNCPTDAVDSPTPIHQAQNLAATAAGIHALPWASPFHSPTRSSQCEGPLCSSTPLLQSQTMHLRALGVSPPPRGCWALPATGHSCFPEHKFCMGGCGHLPCLRISFSEDQ